MANIVAPTVIVDQAYYNTLAVNLSAIANDLDAAVAESNRGRRHENWELVEATHLQNQMDNVRDHSRRIARHLREFANIIRGFGQEYTNTVRTPTAQYLASVSLEVVTGGRGRPR